MVESATTSAAVDARKWPTARPGDVSSIEALIRAFDEALSFEPGGFGRDLDRLRSLFLPTANVASPAPWDLATDAEGFVQFYLQAIPQIQADQAGFAERNVIKRIVSIGGVHSVYTYYTLHVPPANPETAARGVNMFHIVERRGRFWIASCVWEDESDSAPTPEDLQP
jgi:hypothetical protein